MPVGVVGGIYFSACEYVPVGGWQVSTVASTEVLDRRQSCLWRGCVIDEVLAPGLGVSAVNYFNL